MAAAAQGRLTHKAGMAAIQKHDTCSPAFTYAPPGKLAARAVMEVAIQLFFRLSTISA